LSSLAHQLRQAEPMECGVAGAEDRDRNLEDLGLERDEGTGLAS
jgi:hypothetical protein